MQGDDFVPENVQNPQELKRNRIKKICELFEKDITDENIRQYIFGKAGYSIDAVCNTNNYVQYIKNVLSLSFYFTYACYRCDMDNAGETDTLTKHNSKRIINSLKNAFVKYPITHDLIQFVLTDIQFELQSSFSELSDVFGYLSDRSMRNFTFIPYFKLIAEYNNNPSRFQFDGLELLKMFIDLVVNMTFLSNYRLECYGPDIFAFVSKDSDIDDDKYSEMYIHHLFFRDDEHYSGGFYHLFSVDKIEAIADGDIISTETDIRLKYFNQNETWSVVFVIPDNAEKAPHLKGQRSREILNEIACQDWDEEPCEANAAKNISSIDQIHTVNYKYIKNLALAISDTISATDGTKKLIFDRFNRQFPYVFERKTDPKNEKKHIAPYDDKNLDWDAIVIMLLIEASPSTVLEYIIRKVPSAFDTIAKNLYKRVYDIENMKIFSLSSERIKEAVIDIIDAKLIVGESAGFGKIPTAKTYDKLFPKAAAMLILSKLTIVQENDNDESLIYTGNLHSNIALLQKAKDEYEEDKKLRYACIILGETLKHIMCFYEGVFEYGKLKSDYDILTYDKCFSDKEISRYQAKLEQAFIDAAKQTADKLSGRNFVEPNATIEFYNEFILFCEKCNPANNATTEAAKYLYTAIGKYEIMNTSVMKKYFKELERASSNPYSYDVQSWIGTTMEILEYLKTGSTVKTPKDYNLFNAVYPFTAIFDKRKENSDGHKTVNFALNIDIDDDTCVDYQFGVSVLSEFVYNRNEAYYCLPNVLRSNYKWWIDPVLINFRDFNDIFLDKSGKDEF